MRRIFGGVVDYLKISVWATYMIRANVFVYYPGVTSPLVMGSIDTSETVIDKYEYFSFIFHTELKH